MCLTISLFPHREDLAVSLTDVGSIIDVQTALHPKLDKKSSLVIMDSSCSSWRVPPRR